MLTIPDRQQEAFITLRQWVEHQVGPAWVVHRLDKDTSGLVIFARTAAMHAYLSAQFEGRQVTKKYLGLVLGKPQPPEGLIDAPIAHHPANNGTMLVHAKGKPSQTGYALQQALGKYSLLHFNLFTGRTHQIRVHCRHIGHPIACDALYGDGQPILLSQIKKKYKLSKNEDEEKPILNRLALHAHQLSFTLPDGTLVEAEAPLYKDMRALISQLQKL